MSVQKQIWEITRSDIERHPVWVFPMSEDEDCDEATVRPATKAEINDPNTQIIVECEFKDAKGCSYFGFIYWSKPVCIEHCQPLLWVGENPVGFWFGIQRPEESDVPKMDFPIMAKSREAGLLESIELEILGYGYIIGSNVAYTS